MPYLYTSLPPEHRHGPIPVIAVLMSIRIQEWAVQTYSIEKQAVLSVPVSSTHASMRDANLVYATPVALYGRLPARNLGRV